MQEAKTGWMEANAGQVIYNGGNTVKLPKIRPQKKDPKRRITIKKRNRRKTAAAPHISRRRRTASAVSDEVESEDEKN